MLRRQVEAIATALPETDGPRDRLRAGLGDRHRQDRDARDGAGGARVHQDDLLDVPGALRRLGQAGERRRARRAARRRRRARRRRLARPGIVRRDLPRSFPPRSARHPRRLGLRAAGPGNAVELADTPVFDRLWREYPHTTIEASGEAAGLPPGQMGNSEVGHLTIGAGRRLYQDLMRVNKAIEDGSLFESPVLRGAFERGRRVHLLGLVSQGGVHSHIDHLRALLALRAGEDVDPRVHRRPRRLAARRDRRPRDAAAGSDRHRRRPLLGDGPRQALGADAARLRRDRRGHRRPRRERARRGAGELRRRASPTSSSSRS